MFGVVAWVQELTVTPGEWPADADLIHYTMGASEKAEEQATRKPQPRRRTRRILSVQIAGHARSVAI